MTDPFIISSYEPGIHGADLAKTIARLDQDKAWKDLSCIRITPAGGQVPTRCAAAWEALIKPPNSKFASMWPVGVEVGEAYSRTIEGLLSHPELSKWGYILTIEHDNCPPADGFVKLVRRMDEQPEFAAIGGLYFTKGDSGVAQIWGSPHEQPMNFRPQKPDPNGGLVECNGLGMGFTIFRLSMFKDDRLRRPWFKTTASREEGAATQDLYAWNDFRKHGYRCAVDCSIRVGHFDGETMW